MEKAEPFGFRKGTITVSAPPIELNPEIVMPDIHPEITVEVAPPVIKFEPTVKMEPVIRVEPPAVNVTVEMPESKGWKFVIHKRRDGDIEMTAKPL